MADLMIDIETLATGPDAMVMTIAAQVFDPLSTGWPDRHFYARRNLLQISASQDASEMSRTGTGKISKICDI